MQTVCSATFGGEAHPALRHLPGARAQLHVLLATDSPRCCRAPAWPDSLNSVTTALSGRGGFVSTPLCRVLAVRSPPTPAPPQSPPGTAASQPTDRLPGRAVNPPTGTQTLLEHSLRARRAGRRFVTVVPSNCHRGTVQQIRRQQGASRGSTAFHRRGAEKRFGKCFECSCQ